MPVSERKKASAKLWREAHRAELVAASTKWNKENPDKIKVYNKTRYAKNPEKSKASSKKWRQDNRERVNELARIAYAANPENAKKKRAAMLRRLYNLTPEEYDAMSEKQGHVCAICKKPGELVVDHCHKTGRVRGLPCRLCNKGIGIFRDDPAILQSVIDYLERCKQ